MRSVSHRAGLKVSFLSPALALPWSRQRGGSLDNLVPVLLQSLHFFLMFCGKGRARKLEPPSSQCKTLCSSFSFGILSSRSLRWHQKLQDINRMEQSLGHCPCRRCHLMCPTLSRLTALCFPWSCLVCAGQGQGWAPGLGQFVAPAPQMCSCLPQLLRDHILRTLFGPVPELLLF